MSADTLAVFCAAFTILGAKLLYWSSQPVTIGSVILTALVSASTAHLLAAGDAPVLALDVYNRTTGLVCGFRDAFAPLRIACALIQRDGPSHGSNDSTGRFAEL